MAANDVGSGELSAGHPSAPSAPHTPRPAPAASQPTTAPAGNPAPAPLEPSTSGTGLSEAQLFERCKAAVEACREEAADLRTAVKAARSHREKSVSLLAAANEAVLGLEDVLYSTGVEGPWERVLHQLATRVQAGIDRGEAVVKVYGSMGGVGKLLSRMAGPAAAPAKYDECTAELLSLAAQARRLLQGNRSQHGTGAIASASPTAAAPPLSVEPVRSEFQQGSAPLGALDEPPASSAAHSPSGGQPGEALPPLLGSSSAHSQAASFTTTTLSTRPPRAPLVLGGRELPAQAALHRRLRKSSRQETIAAMAYVPPTPTDAVGSAGRVWWYASKIFGSDKFLVHDLSSGVEQAVEGGKGEGAVSCMHLDAGKGVVWTGHRSGAVM